VKSIAFLHSFHSQVPFTLSELDELPDLFLALDSHTDAHFGTSDVISTMPEDVQLAAGRGSSHTLIRRAIGELPPF